jgi:hypothetical protein
MTKAFDAAQVGEVIRYVSTDKKYTVYFTIKKVNLNDYECMVVKTNDKFFEIFKDYKIQRFIKIDTNYTLVDAVIKDKCNRCD